MTTWREQAVARSLDSARARAEERVQRFLDAALELMRTEHEFTVQEVVDRSGQSLRSFYQHFAGKQELLLALFEESVRSTADQLRASIAREPDPLQRVHRLVVEYHRLCRPAPNGRGAKTFTPAMAEFAQQLLTAQPDEAGQAFTPLVALFDETLAAARDAGTVRSDAAITGVLLQAIMFNAFAAVISGTTASKRDDAAEELWDLFLNGIGSPR